MRSHYVHFTVDIDEECPRTFYYNPRDKCLQTDVGFTHVRGGFEESGLVTMYPNSLTSHRKKTILAKNAVASVSD